MKKVIINTLLPCLFYLLCNSTFGQYYNTTQIDQIKSEKSASEGDFYLDTLNHVFYIGLSNGILQHINFDSTDVKSIFQRYTLTDVHLLPASDTNTASQKSIKTYVDSLFNITGHETIFPIYAEENGNLAVSTAYQYSFGNGATSTNGLILPETCTLFAVGLTLGSGSGEVTVYKNNTITSATSGLATASSSSGAINILTTPIEFNSGDVVNFKTSIANSAARGRAVAWFKVSKKIPLFARYNGSSIPSITLGTDGDEYLHITTGDLYIKESGIWNLKLNIKGPVGSSSAKAFVQVTNTNTTNLNSGTTLFNWINTNTSSITSNDITKFTVASDGITFTNTGTYKITITQNQICSSTTERTNPAIQLILNGSSIGPKGANGYIRNSGGHNESTASLIYVVSANGGQKIGFQNTQLTTSSATVTCPANGLVFLIEEM